MTTEMIENASGITIKSNGRTVFTTEGRLISFLPTENTYTFNAAFPDALKGKIGLWAWSSVLSPPGAPDAYGYTIYGIAAVGARPQERSDIIVLGDAPPGANLFLGRARLTRTKNPSHSWMGQTITPPDFVGRWVSVSGSMLMEQAVGFARAISIYVADGTPGREGPAGKLVANLAQSVSGQSGGYRSWSRGAAFGTSSGGENAWLGSGGIGQLVWSPTSGTGRKTSTGVSADYITIPFNRHRWNGSDPPVYSDPTDYASTYSIQLVGRFGRAPV